jgi:transposase InsO family protein
VRDILILAIHLLVTLAKLLRPGGVRAVAAESLLLKHQLLISNRSRQRAPNLTSVDRFVLGLATLFVRPHRLPKLGALVRPATLLKIHAALVEAKYRRLFSSSASPRRKPGPKGPSWLTFIAQARDSLWSVGLFRCESILLHSHWVLVVIDVFTRRIIGFGIERGSIDGMSVCRMFNHAVTGRPPPKQVSTDHDPLFRFHRWRANLRVREIEEVKSVPYAPVSHPFVERLIGTIRREYLDRVLFWNAVDLARKLEAFRDYYNDHRVHRAIAGLTPAQRAGALCPAPAALDHYGWQQHCRGLFELPVAA